MTTISTFNNLNYCRAAGTALVALLPYFNDLALLLELRLLNMLAPLLDGFLCFFLSSFREHLKHCFINSASYALLPFSVPKLHALGKQNPYEFLLTKRCAAGSAPHKARDFAFVPNMLQLSHIVSTESTFYSRTFLQPES